MKFRPLHDRVVVKRVAKETKTAGGIIIPDTARKAAGRRSRRRRPRRARRSRQAHAARREGRRPHSVRQMVGHRSEDRRRRSPHHEGERHHGRPRDSYEPPTSRLAALIQTTFKGVPQHGCQRRSFFCRCPREDAARRRHPRQRREGDAGPEGPQRRHREVLRRPAHDQGRRHRRQGNRTRRQVREHGRPDDARSRLQDQRRRRRRHHHRHRAGPGHRPRRPEVRRGRHEPDGSAPRHRQGRRQVIAEIAKKSQEGQELRRDRPGRHHLGQRRQGHRRHDRRSHGKGRQRRRHHRRRSQGPRDRTRSRRRHAVRPRLSLAVLHHQRRQDGSPNSKIPTS